MLRDMVPSIAVLIVVAFDHGTCQGYQKETIHLFSWGGAPICKQTQIPEEAPKGIPKRSFLGTWVLLFDHESQCPKACAV